MGAHITKLEDGSVEIRVVKSAEETYDPSDGQVYSVAVVSAEEWAKLSKFKSYEAPAVEVITENLAPEPEAAEGTLEEVLAESSEEPTDGNEG